MSVGLHLKQRFNDSITRSSFTRWYTFAFSSSFNFLYHQWWLHLLPSLPISLLLTDEFMTKAGFAVVDFFSSLHSWDSIYIRFALTGSTACMFIQHQRPYYYSCIFSFFFMSFYFLFSFPFYGVRVWKRHTGQRWNRALHCNISGLPNRGYSLSWITFPSFACFLLSRQSFA